MDTICNVCAEYYNKSTRTKIECSCGYMCCKQCMKIYILSLSDDAKCMSQPCSKVFDRQFLYKYIDRKFLDTTYKSHIEDILFVKATPSLEVIQKELSFTKIKAQYDKDIFITTCRITTLRLFFRHLEKLAKKINDKFRCPVIVDETICNTVLNKQLFCTKCKYSINDRFHKINEPLLDTLYDINKIRDIRDLYDRLEIDINDHNFHYSVLDTHLDVTMIKQLFKKIVPYILLDAISYHLDMNTDIFFNLNKERSKILNVSVFIRLCPNNMCNGFLNEMHICEICDCISCEHCREIKTNKHQCNPDILKSIELIKNDSKPCPGCKSLIHKIIGCPHMYCTKCKTYFDWNTLNILDKRNINNPEYFDEMRHGMQRNPYDILCGRELDYNFEDDLKKSIYTDINNTYISSVLTSVKYIKGIKIREFDIDLTNANNRLKRDYLLTVITKSVFKCKLQQNKKKTERCKDILDILVAFYNSMIELFHRLHHDAQLLHNVDNDIYITHTTHVKQENLLIEGFKTESLCVVDIANVALGTTAKLYNTTKYSIDQYFVFM